MKGNGKQHASGSQGPRGPGAHSADAGGHPKRTESEREQDMSRDLAVAIAFGNAASTFEVVGTHAESVGRMPAGRYWFAGGAAVERHVADGVLAALTGLVESDGAVPADALFGHVRARFALGLDGGFAEQALATRLAYAAFAASLLPLLTEARRAAEMRAAAATSVAHVPPPDIPGTFGERIFTRPRFGERYELSRRKAAAE